MVSGSPRNQVAHICHTRAILKDVQHGSSSERLHVHVKGRPRLLQPHVRKSEGKYLDGEGKKGGKKNKINKNGRAMLEPRRPQDIGHICIFFLICFKGFGRRQSEAASD